MTWNHNGMRGKWGQSIAEIYYNDMGEVVCVLELSSRHNSPAGFTLIAPPCALEGEQVTPKPDSTGNQGYLQRRGGDRQTWKGQHLVQTP